MKRFKKFLLIDIVIIIIIYLDSLIIRGDEKENIGLLLYYKQKKSNANFI
jgi:hypothetical protein